MYIHRKIPVPSRSISLIQRSSSILSCCLSLHKCKKYLWCYHHLMHLQDLSGWPPKVLIFVMQWLCISKKNNHFISSVTALWFYCPFFPPHVPKEVGLFSLCSHFRKIGEKIYKHRHYHEIKNKKEYCVTLNWGKDSFPMFQSILPLEQLWF